MICARPAWLYGAARAVVLRRLHADGIYNNKVLKPANNGGVRYWVLLSVHESKNVPARSDDANAAAAAAAKVCQAYIYELTSQVERCEEILRKLYFIFPSSKKLLAVCFLFRLRIICSAG